MARMARAWSAASASSTRIRLASALSTVIAVKVCTWAAEFAGRSRRAVSSI